MPKTRLVSWCAALAVLVAAFAVAGCGGGSGEASSGRPGERIAGIEERQLRVTTTANFITDLAGQIGGERVEVTGLMGAGVDPHLYKASAGDVGRLEDADVIFYGGLELEGRMSDLLIEMAAERTTVAVTRDIPESRLLEPPEFQGKFDPHVWFDIDLWRLAAETVADVYTQLDPQSDEYYSERLRNYLRQLDDLQKYAEAKVAEVPEQSRVLVTAHDAFNYFGRAHGFEVEAIQGISTATEATTADIDRVARLIAQRRLKAVFIESSVPRQTIDAVLAAAAKGGWRARVGGSLFSDAAGDPGSEEGTYIGMLRHNVDTIVEGLK